MQCGDVKPRRIDEARCLLRDQINRLRPQRPPEFWATYWHYLAKAGGALKI